MRQTTAEHAERRFGEHALELQAGRSPPVRSRGWLVRRVLLTADLAGLTLAFAGASLIFDTDASAGAIGTVGEALLFVALLPGWVVAAKLHGLYDRDEERTGHGTIDDLAGVFHLATAGAWLFILGAWATGLARPDPAKLFTLWALAVALVTLGRVVGRTVCRTRPSYVQNVVIVGADDAGRLLGSKYRNHPEYGVNLLGFVDTIAPEPAGGGGGGETILGPLEELASIVRRLDVDRVVIGFPRVSRDKTVELTRTLRELGVQIDLVPRLFEVISPANSFHSVEGFALVGLPPAQLAPSSQLLKRMTDVGVSAAGLVALAPVLALIAALIKLDSRGPVLFRQVRMGGSGRIFRIAKFRTMVADADAHKGEVAHLNKHLDAGGDPRMFKIPDDPRLTRVGRFLRRYSLDELPQLLNVLRGEMSLVGPRPLIPEEDRHVREWARHRLDLAPGITGPWQVLGRSDIEFEEMLRLDYLYVTTWSLGKDLELLCRTIPAVLGRRHGAY